MLPVAGVGPGVGLVYDERMCAHEHLYERSHPEQPERIRSIFNLLRSAGIAGRCVRVGARNATYAELESVHDGRHITNIMDQSFRAAYRKTRRWAEPPTGSDLLNDDNDIYFNEESHSSALLAAGSVVDMSLRVARGDLRAGAAVVRPPGHHAEHNVAMGFCLFNNVAIAAKVLVNGSHPEIAVKRVLIVDWDIHHGNGTQKMFWKDPRVFYFSIHRQHLYPGGEGKRYEDGDYDKVGEGNGAGFNINVPWPRRGFGDRDYLAVFEDLLLPVAQEFNPDLVLVSAGFDSADGDPLGDCKVTPAGYSQMTKKLMDLANGRLVLVLEGGYDLEATSKSYLACMKVILGEPPEDLVDAESPPGSEITGQLVEKIRRLPVLQNKWTAFSMRDNSPANSGSSSGSNYSNVRRATASGGVNSEVENVSDEDEGADLVHESGHNVNHSPSLGQGPENNEVVTVDCSVGNSLIKTEGTNEDEKSSPDGAKLAGTDQVSSSGVFSLVEEPKVHTQMVLETIDQNVVAGDLGEVNGRDADEQRPHNNTRTLNQRSTRNAREEKYKSRKYRFCQCGELPEGDKLENSDLAGPLNNLQIH